MLFCADFICINYLNAMFVYKIYQMLFQQLVYCDFCVKIVRFVLTSNMTYDKM